MMKLEDPVAPFRGIVAEYRRARPAPDTDIFRFGGHAPTGHLRSSEGPVAVLGASDWALDPARAEKTFAHIGMLGGLLADLGYDVYSVGSLPELDRPPSFIGWVGGEESQFEQAQLAALDVPGVAIGPSVDGVASLGNTEPDDHLDSLDLIRAALDEIRRQTDGEQGPKDAVEPSDASTAPSTVRPGTGSHGAGWSSYDDPRSSSSGARSGTERDGLNGRPELITRRSAVQIRPPPPSNTQVRPHFSEWGLLLLGGASTGSSTGPGSAGAGDLRIRGGVRR